MMMLRNCSGSENRLCVTTFAVNSVSRAIGCSPRPPPAVWLFCSVMALSTCEGESPNPASFDGSSQIRIAYCDPKSWTSPTPLTRRSSVTTLLAA